MGHGVDLKNHTIYVATQQNHAGIFLVRPQLASSEADPESAFATFTENGYIASSEGQPWRADVTQVASLRRAFGRQVMTRSPAASLSGQRLANSVALFGPATESREAACLGVHSTQP